MPSKAIGPALLLVGQGSGSSRPPAAVMRLKNWLMLVWLTQSTPAGSTAIPAIVPSASGKPGNGAPEAS